MNKVISHIYDIYIASNLFKKRFEYKSFADHNTVTFINKMKNKCHRLGLMLQEYNLIIKHIKCKDTNVLFTVG
jgi:hypothetical protein